MKYAYASENLVYRSTRRLLSPSDTRLADNPLRNSTSNILIVSSWNLVDIGQGLFPLFEHASLDHHSQQTQLRGPPNTYQLTSRCLHLLKSAPFCPLLVLLLSMDPGFLSLGTSSDNSKHLSWRFLTRAPNHQDLHFFLNSTCPSSRLSSDICPSPQPS